MIDREHDLSITRQAEVLQISRGSVYYLPRLTFKASACLVIGRSCSRSIIALRSAIPPW